MPVNVTGVDSTLKALRDFDPNLYKAMNKEIKAVMIPIPNNARGYLPSNSEVLSNWHRQPTSENANYRPFPAYDQATAAAGIVYRQGSNKRQKNGWTLAYYVANKSAAGAIYETAGRLSEPERPSESLNPYAREQFLKPLPELYGKDKKRGRLIFRAWEKDYGKATIGVQRAIDNTVRQFNQSTFALAA